MTTAAAPDAIKFGTDGWRGLMAREFTFENVRRVAQALADMIREDAATPGQRKKSPLGQTIWVGYDRRFQSDAFAREVARVLKGNRLCPCLIAESLPTPAVSFLTHKSQGLGVMVTASHNPAHYNGIKLKRDGRAVPENVTQALESHLDKSLPALDSDFPEKSCRQAYVAYLKSRVNPAKLLPRMKRPIVVDYMHGAAAGLLEAVLPSKQIVAIRAARDPLFGGTPPEPIEANLQPLSAAVKEQKALLGLALDGDGDRIGLVDEKGAYFTPCQVFPMLISYLVEKKNLRGKIVQSVSMGYLSGRMAKALGLEFEELPVGFKHVAEKLAEGSAVIGGEESGGYAWKGGLPERDGLVTALLALEMCLTQGLTLSQVWKSVEERFGKSFFRRVDYRVHRPVADKAAFAAKILKRLPKKILGSPIQSSIPIDGLKVILEGDHWVLMRPSGTEPLMRVYAETDSAERTTALLELARKWVGSTS